jgi:hypothetical protein
MQNSGKMHPSTKRIVYRGWAKRKHMLEKREAWLKRVSTRVTEHNRDIPDLAWKTADNNTRKKICEILRTKQNITLFERMTNIVIRKAMPCKASSRHRMIMYWFLRGYGNMEIEGSIDLSSLVCKAIDNSYSRKNEVDYSDMGDFGQW